MEKDMHSRHTGKFQFGFWIGRKDHNGVIELRQKNGDRREVKEGSILEMQIGVDGYNKLSHLDGPLLCSQGMHACFTPYDCMRYHSKADPNDLHMFFVAVTGRIQYGKNMDYHKFCGDYRTHLVDLGNLRSAMDFYSPTWAYEFYNSVEANVFDKAFFNLLNARDPNTLPAIVDVLKEEGTEKDLKVMRKYRSKFVKK